MQDYKTLSFSSELPYPSIEIKEKNSFYGKCMLDNIGGANSEMSAISLYFYNNLISSTYPDVSYIFHKVSIVEMHHLELFGKIALELGEDPRLWAYCNRCSNHCYWTPNYNQYPTILSALLKHAIQNEHAAIQKYESQILQIKDCCIIENLKRIILDETLHIELFETLYKEHCC